MKGKRVPYQQTGDFHFLTFSCHRRRACLESPKVAGGPPKFVMLHDQTNVGAPFKTCSLRFEWDTTNPIPLIAKERDERGTESSVYSLSWHLRGS
jgi:hypothetical protein